MQNDVEKILLTKEQIAEKVESLGKELSNDFKDEKPLLVCILKGSVVFFADLIRAISIPIEIDFMSISSYGLSTKSSGEVKIIKDLDTSIENKHIIIVEDIVDSGYTLSYLKRLLFSRNPKSIKICTLLDKKERRVCDIEPDYVGFDIPDEFIIGYGLDYAEKYRNLSYIGVLKRSIYEK